MLNEVKRMDMIKAAKIQSPDRFLKTHNYNVRQFKEVDFKQLFEDDTFLWYGGIGDHVVIIQFDGAFADLKWLVSGMRGKNRVERITLDIVTKALSKSLDDNDLYVECSCPDWLYRFRYYATQKGYNAGPNQNIRPKFKKTNVYDDKGYVCKHILTALYGKRWLQSAARSWLNWMKANVELTEFYLFDKPINSDDEEDE